MPRDSDASTPPHRRHKSIFLNNAENTTPSPFDAGSSGREETAPTDSGEGMSTSDFSSRPPSPGRLPRNESKEPSGGMVDGGMSRAEAIENATIMAASQPHAGYLVLPDVDGLGAVP